MLRLTDIGSLLQVCLQLLLHMKLKTEICLHIIYISSLAIKSLLSRISMLLVVFHEKTFNMICKATWKITPLVRILLLNM